MAERAARSDGAVDVWLDGAERMGSIDDGLDTVVFMVIYFAGKMDGVNEVSRQPFDSDRIPHRQLLEGSGRKRR
jgi:hypothetical protein